MHAAHGTSVGEASVDERRFDRPLWRGLGCGQHPIRPGWITSPEERRARRLVHGIIAASILLLAGLTALGASRLPAAPDAAHDAARGVATLD